MLFGLLAALATGATLVASGVLKLSDMESAVLAVEGLGFLPPSLSRVVGVCLPFLEIAAGAGLMLGRLMPWATGLSLLLCAAFAVASIRALNAEVPIACACFGPWELGRLGWGSLLHAAYLGTLSLWGLLTYQPDNMDMLLRVNLLQTSLPILCLAQLGIILRLAFSR
jgi:uncharacterized membrane protein YphA (DoxX/SURF4 family)